MGTSEFVYYYTGMLGSEALLVQYFYLEVVLQGEIILLLLELTLLQSELAQLWFQLFFVLSIIIIIIIHIFCYDALTTQTTFHNLCINEIQ